MPDLISLPRQVLSRVHPEAIEFTGFLPDLIRDLPEWQKKVFFDFLLQFFWKIIFAFEILNFGHCDLFGISGLSGLVLYLFQHFTGFCSCRSERILFNDFLQKGSRIDRIVERQVGIPDFKQ